MKLALALLVAGTLGIAGQASAQEDASIGAIYAADAPSVVLSWSREGGPWTVAASTTGTLRLPRGPIDLGLSLHDHGPVRVASSVVVPEGALLSARYESRRWMRELGVGVVLGGILAALVGLAIGIGAYVDHTPDTGVAGLAAGLGVGVVGITTGVVLAIQEDDASLDIE